jgi:cell division protein FtsZ
MTLNLSMPGNDELKPRITVFGVGGAGGNAVNNMIEKQLDGVDFVVANTDAQALQQSAAPNRVQLGIKVTEGLGAGARASVGAAAAEESIEQIVAQVPPRSSLKRPASWVFSLSASSPSPSSSKVPSG